MLSQNYTSVESVAELRATAVPTDQVLYLEGFYSPGDGGEGMFWFNASDTTSDNDGTIIPDAAGNRWYRATDGQPYSVKWFGARGDGATDDILSIRKTILAVQALPLNGTVWFPAGAYLITDTIAIYEAVTLCGEANKTQRGATRIVPSSMGFHALSIIKVNFGVVIRGIDIGPVANPTEFGFDAITIYASQRVDIEDVSIYGTWNGISNDSSGDVYIRRSSISLADVPPQSGKVRYGIKCTGRAYRLSKQQYPLDPTRWIGNPNLTQCDTVIVSDYGTYEGTAHGFILADTYNSLTLTNCGALNCAFARWMTADGGGAPDFLVDTAGVSDHCSTGWALDSAAPDANIMLAGCLCTSSFRNNFYVNNTFAGDVQFTGCRAINTGGSSQFTGAGFSLNGTGNYTLSGCTANGNGGHNVAISNSAKVSISGGVFSRAGNSTNPDKDAFHIYASTSGSLSISGILQYTASRGLFDEGSQCLVWGSGVFLPNPNNVVVVDLSANNSTARWGRPSGISHP
jgi:hypothetical protein